MGTKFSVHVRCGQTAEWIKMPLGMEVGLGPGDIVLHGVPAPRLSPPQKKGGRRGKGHSPQFSAKCYCGQTAGWIKMPLDTEVALGPGDVVLDGDSAPPKTDTAPTFRPMSIVAKRSPIFATAEHL